MSRDSVLARGRAMAEASMTDTCTIRQETGKTTDDRTGRVTPTWTIVYTGACRFQQSPAMGQTADSAETLGVVLRRVLQLPVLASAGVREGDVVTVDTCANDPDMVGRVFRLRDEHGKSEATARRMTCEEQT